MKIEKKIDLSVVVPMFNEEENVLPTLEKLTTALEALSENWEVLVVDDGSTDRTKNLVQSFSQKDGRVRLISYAPNQGRGKALRVGFKHAQGEIICTTDADLSYHESYLIKMANVLKENPELDLVVGSPYASGGSVEGVSFFRLLISRVANKILGFAMKGGFSAVTGILRAYRRECILSLDLESDDKEIHLEILSKAQAMGYQALEIPATLRKRLKGKSKFKFKTTALSHVIFSFYEKPIILFGLVGLALLTLGFIGGIYIIYLWQKGELNPNRPLMTLMVLLTLSGIQVLLFGFIGTQIMHLKRELYKMHRKEKILEEKIKGLGVRVVDEIRKNLKKEKEIEEKKIY